MDNDMKELLTTARDLYIEAGEKLIIDDPIGEVEEAYNDGIRSALLIGYIEGASDAVLQNTESLIEHVIGFKVLMSKLEKCDYHHDSGHEIEEDQ